MKVLLIGGYGFIGSEIGRALIARGDMVIGFGRDVAYGRRVLPAADWRQGDLRDFARPDAWCDLDGIDAVVNASGLLQDESGHSVKTVQADAIMALLTACEAAGVDMFVQVSAANAEADAPSAFLRSKAVADRAIGASLLRHVILRPGLVIGRNAYGGTELLRAAAALPFTGLAFRGTGLIQCVGMADLTDAVLRALDGLIPDGRYDLVEPRRRTLTDILALHRAWLGYAPPAWMLSLGPILLRFTSRGADLLGRLGWRSPLRSNAILSLTGGISGDANSATDVLGREPLALEAVLAGAPAGKQDRIAARSYLLLPLMLGTLFIMWFGSALFTWIGFAHATAIIAGGGVGRPLASLFAGGGAVLDGLLALMLLHRHTVQLALWGTVVVTIGYLAGATLLRPDLWSDPLAPLLKVFPALILSLTCLSLVERR